MIPLVFVGFKAKVCMMVWSLWGAVYCFIMLFICLVAFGFTSYF